MPEPITESYCAACGSIAKPLAIRCSKCSAFFAFTVTVSEAVAFRVPFGAARFVRG